MAKATLIPVQQELESALISTLIAGLHSWRPDLSYPQSHSDMQACARAAMAMFKIERSPLPIPLYSPCSFCMGTGYLTFDDRGTRTRRDCERCDHGRVEVEAITVLALLLLAAVPYLVIPTDDDPGFCMRITSTPGARWCHSLRYAWREGASGPAGMPYGVIFCPSRELAECVAHERCHLEDPRAACGH